jgi:hypothetical protein
LKIKPYVEPICVGQGGQKPKGGHLDDKNIFFKKVLRFQQE